jgi:hypothetical protein
MWRMKDKIINGLAAGGRPGAAQSLASKVAAAAATFAAIVAKILPNTACAFGGE